MNDTPKTPMVVWLGGHRTGFLATTTEQSDMTPDGPYVHLDQFIEEVEERAKGIMQKWNINIVEARGEALRLIADKLRR